LDTALSEHAITEKSGSSVNQYNPALEGLRGSAIILVILYHNFNFISYFNYGWLGVDLFFVLSGFLITNILLNTLHKKNYFKSFYARRALRIFPLYYLVLILFLVIFPAIKNFPLDLSYYVQHQWWFWTYLQNWCLIFFYNDRSNVLTHLWSLAVEEQYYLVWPLLIFFVKKPKNLLLICLAALLLIIASRVWIWNNKESFFTHSWLFLFTRIDGILVGSILSLLLFNKPYFLQRYFTLLVLFLAILNFSFYFLNRIYQFNYPPWDIVGYTTFSAMFALAVYEVVQNKNGLLHTILSFSFLKFLGKYSYGLYVFHWPVYALLFSRLHSVMPIQNLRFNQLVSAFICTAAAILISVVSYHVFEVRFLRLKRFFA
jgi:peptidoglycan/LPS O-acetylase OafA/YrhL